ncbi:ATP-binding protein [Desmonostoc muscorum CCALA 125]|nr:ATP-binding protein [Desmonostoc muscorum CCALA 125]
MASIDEIILRSTNPFDNIRSVNFWHTQPQLEPTVDSIHHEAIAAITPTLDQVIKDHRTRTVVLDGDAGSGKTYLLGRLKKAFNHKAFFVYIPPFPQSDYIWRHILRYTVDSLVQIPEGQKDSQLLLWLINVLSAIKQRGVKERLFKDDIFNLLRSDRRKFISTLKNTYKQAAIYNADNFFAVLHDLTNSELYPLACEWLRGDDLSEESLQALRIKSSIGTEQAAREILANFSRIAGDTQPIVLCFDQLESIARLPDGSIDLQALFNVNTKIRDEDNNFLIIISIATNTWEQNKSRIDQSHKARIYDKVDLKNISLVQAESLLASRLYFLHRQAHPQPTSPIYPFVSQYLEEGFPGGKTNPREAIIFGRDIFQEYKEWLAQGGRKNNFQPSYRKEPSDLLAAFKLKWREELTKVQQRITRVRHLSSPELIQMVEEALAALQVDDIKTPLLTGTRFANYSLGYQLPNKSRHFGVIWTEDANMTTFFHVMEACGKAIKKDPSLTLYLIRAEILGNSNNKGYQRYVEIFSGGLSHRLIVPNITSIHYLATYHSLVRDAREGDLVIGGQTVSWKNLQVLIRESKVLHDCALLQDLEIIKKNSETSAKHNGNGNGKKNNDIKLLKLVPEVKPIKPPKEIIESKDLLFNLVKTQHFIARQELIKNVRRHFPVVSESQTQELIQQLCQENKIKIIDPNLSLEAQLMCLVTKK